MIFPQILLLLAACERSGPPPAPPADPWPDEAEVLFQEAEVLKYELERRRQEAERLRARGIEGAPPRPRP